jgi:hypothetical protein
VQPVIRRLCPDDAEPEGASGESETDIERDDRHRTTSGTIGRCQVQGIEGARARLDPEFGRPATDGIVERHDE